MSSISGAALGQAQTQASISSVVLKNAFETEQKFADAIKEASEQAPVEKSRPADGTGRNVDVSA